MNIYSRKNTKGFTLIELLVVVAIIGLLASIVLSSLNAAQAKARNTKRLQDMHQIQTALELYFSTNGQYPSTGGAGNWHAVCSAWNTPAVYTTTGASGYIPSLAPTFIPVLPTDPKPTAAACYLYTSTGADYMFLVYNTFEGGAPVPTSFQRPIESGNTAEYAVYTPGAASW